MDPIDVEDAQEIYNEVVEEKERQYRQENAGRCKRSSTKKKVYTRGEAPSTSHKKVVDVEKTEEGKEEVFDGYHVTHHGVLQQLVGALSCPESYGHASLLWTCITNCGHASLTVDMHH